MLFGEALTEVLWPAPAVVLLAQQPSDMARSGAVSAWTLLARSWSSFCLGSPVPHPLWARAQDLLSTWEMLPWLCESTCGFLGRREGSLLPYFSHSHRELEIHCVVAASAEMLPTQAACTADVQAAQTFSDVWCAWHSVHAYHLTIIRTGRKVWGFFCCCCCCCCFSYSF